MEIDQTTQLALAYSGRVSRVRVTLRVCEVTVPAPEAEEVPGIDQTAQLQTFKVKIHILDFSGAVNYTSSSSALFLLLHRLAT